MVDITPIVIWEKNKFMEPLDIPDKKEGLKSEEPGKGFNRA